LSGEVTLRPATDDDRDLLVEVYAGTRAEELAMVPWDDAQKRAFVEMQFEAQAAHYRNARPEATYDVILEDSEPVGRLIVDREVPEIHIVDIALLPAARGRGIGGELLGRLLAEADAAGRDTSIYVELQNRARALYERLGFEEVERGDVYALMRRSPCNSGPLS
jgi:ribosomal protein S18 acetylase RimI-like enzyme